MRATRSLYAAALLVPLFSLQIVVTFLSSDASYWASLYSIVFLLLLMSLFVGRFSWFYLYLVAFVTLGLWVKTSLHEIFDYDYVDPIGQFSDSPEEWDDFYFSSSLIVSGLLAGRSLLLLSRLTPRLDKLNGESRLLGNRPIGGSLWTASAIAIVGFYVFNSQIGFFVTGVHAAISLPFGLNAPFAFFSWIGLALVVCLLVSHDNHRRGYLPRISAGILLLQGSAASISMISRLAFVLHTVPVLLALTNQRHVLHRSPRTFLIPAVVVLFAVLLIVFLYRISIYSLHEVDFDSMAASFISTTSLLFVDRWIGAEAIMSAVSFPNRSIAIFGLLVLEQPNEGVYGLYQLISNSGYEEIVGKTFLSLPGFVGILTISESWIVMTLGSAFVVFFGGLVERLMASAVPVRAVVALGSAALANAICQISFPLLLVPFVVQLIGFFILLRILFRISTQSAPQKVPISADAANTA